MIKGTKVQATNATYVGTGATVTNMLTIPAGKTFVLTDLIAVGSYAIDKPTTTATANEPLALYDGAGDSATELSGTSAKRIMVHFPMVSVATNETGAVPTYQRTGMVLHFTNGPEFVTGVTPAIYGAGGANIVGTGCIWIGGILR